MKRFTGFDYSFLSRYNRNFLALSAGVVTLGVYWLMLSPMAYPGSSAKLISICLGLEPALTPDHPLWMNLASSARCLPAGIAVYMLNLSSALCGALSVALLFRYISRWVESRIVLNDELPEHAPKVAGLAAGLIGAFAFASSLPFWGACTRFSMAPFHALLLLIAFNLLQDNIDSEDRWRPFALALLCGIGCAESALFLLMTPFFMIVLLLALYRRGQSSWALVAGLALTGLLGTSLYTLAASQFVGSELFTLTSSPGRMVLVERMLIAQLDELQLLFTQSGWIWVVLMVFIPWLIIQFTARSGYYGRNEVSSLVFHVVLILLILPVQFNSSVLPWSANLPEGRLPVLEILLVSMSLSYLLSFWVLRLMELPTIFDPTDQYDLKKREEAHKNQKGLKIMSGVIAGILVLMIATAAMTNADSAGGRGGHFMDSYVRTLLGQLKPESWIVTDGLLDTNLRLVAYERDQTIKMVNLAAERSPLEILQLCKKIETDPDFAEDTVRYLNAARLGCAAFLQEWLTTDPDAVGRVVFYASPDLLFEAGFNARADQLVFIGVRDMAALKGRPLIEEQREFWENMMVMLDGAVKDAPLAALRAALRRHVSMAANNLGVLLEDLERPEEAILAYHRALKFDPDNFSTMLNRVVLTRKGVTPLDAEAAEQEAAAALEALKQRPVSGRLARHYGYVRVPGEFFRQSAEWMRFGQPKLAEVSLKRAMELAPAGEQNQFLLELAALHLSNNKPDAGEAAFLQVLESAPADPRALLGMVRVANMRQEHSTARSWLDKAGKAGVDNRQVSMELAKIESAEGDYAGARQRLQAITDADPANLEAWALQANLLISQKKTEEAERDILPRMKALSLNSPRYSTAVTEAYILLAKGADFYKAARESFILASRLQPGSRSVLSEILKIDCALNDQRAMQQHAIALLRLDRDDALANYVMSSILIERDDLAGAEEHLRRSVASVPSLPVYNDLAEVLRMRKKLKEAEAFIRQALALEPKSPVALDTLACILIDTERLDEARQASTAALALAPDSLPLKLTEVRILALSNGDIIEARELVRQITAQAERLSPRQRADLAEVVAQLKKR